MQQANVIFTVRPISETTSIIGIDGEVNYFAESALMDAYDQACRQTTRSIILDFSGLDYMNSGGIGLLVTLLIRMKRQQQRLFAFNLDEHYRRIFELSRLNEAIGIYDSEIAALEAANA
jgi:anti-sigma B factor antagonist